MQRPAAMFRALLAGLVLATAGSAFAAEPAAGGACRADAQKLCAGVQQGGGRMLACLKQHQADLSPDCRAALPAIEACGAKLREVCGENGGRRGLAQCLREQRGKLGDACQGVMPQR